MARYDAPPLPPPRSARGYEDRTYATERDRYERDRLRDRRDPYGAPPPDRYDRDSRPSYGGPVRTGDRREYEPPRSTTVTTYQSDPRREYERESTRDNRFEHDSRTRYAPYPSPGSGSRAPEPHYAPAYPQAAPGVPPVPAQSYYSPSVASGYSVPPAAPHPQVPPASLSQPFDEGRRSDRNSQFSHGPPREKSAPSQSVILMGLPIHTDENNLRAFLEEMGCAIDGCTIIYDRTSGQSKRYGFARFISVEHARAFVEPHFPVVTWKEPRGAHPNPSGDGLKIKIDYSQKEKIPWEARSQHGGAGMDVSGRGRGGHGRPGGEISRHEMQQAATGPINDGARDIGGSPTSILLLRGLDALTTEQDIALHLQNIPDPSGTVTPASVRKVMLVKDRNTRGSWGFAFVQFADVQVAVKALASCLNSVIFPRGFQIKSRVVTVTFAHEHSFHPVYKRSDWSFRSEGAQELAYWDEKAYASVYDPNGGASTASVPAATPNSEQLSVAKDDTDADMDAFLSSIDAEVPARPSPSNGAGVAGSAAVPSSVSNGGPARDVVMQEVSYSPVIGSGPSGAAASPSSGGAPLKDARKTSEPIGGQTLESPLKANAKYQELATKPVTEQRPSAAPEDDNDFRDLVKMTCQLCQRQFKSVTDLDRHVDLSNLHKTNMQDEAMKAAARQRKAATLKAQRKGVEANGQKRGPESAPAPMLQSPQPGQQSSIGNKIPEKMGWSRREGLGEGGKIEPVAAAAPTGVGFGASQAQ